MDALGMVGGIDWDKVIFKGLFIKGIYGREIFETWYKMEAMIRSGLDISPIITHRYNFDDFQKGFDSVARQKAGISILSLQYKARSALRDGIGRVREGCVELLIARAFRPITLTIRTFPRALAS